MNSNMYCPGKLQDPFPASTSCSRCWRPPAVVAEGFVGQESATTFAANQKFREETPCKQTRLNVHHIFKCARLSAAMMQKKSSENGTGMATMDFGSLFFLGEVLPCASGPPKRDEEKFQQS